MPGVTGAALLVRRAAFLAVGGFSTDYIIGDFEDSDLCLALRAAGHEIGYEPAAELFHFERQSITAMPAMPAAWPAPTTGCCSIVAGMAPSPR